jgi:4-hydroxy-2-oxoheptanedioate aldolase
MALPSLRSRLAAGETLYTAWSTIPDPLVAEFTARAGFDAVTLDMQHGCHSTESVMRGVAAVTLLGKPAIVRIPVGDFATASRALDFGAAAVIAPMVNSVADAKAFGASMKFPPLGERSWGPTRVVALSGAPSLQSYLESANNDTLAIAMIETRAAQAALDEILAIESIDGVFVGPSDFSLAYSRGAKIDPNDGEMLKAAAEIARKAAKSGKFPCTLAINGEAARRARNLGFQLIALGSDFSYLTLGAKSLLSESRGAV